MILLIVVCNHIHAQEVRFCGENVPLHNKEIKSKLVRIINKNINNGVNTPQVIARVEKFLPYVEEVLKKYGVPNDFKYLPLVESRLRNVKSHAGAGGYWQIMPGTAKDLGLVINRDVDERNNVIKSTHAACRYISQLYGSLGSWTLTAAAYNFGVGNIGKTIRKQGTKNYYYMALNQETSEYLYHLIACKIIYSGIKIEGKSADNIYIEEKNSKGENEISTEVPAEQIELAIEEKPKSNFNSKHFIKKIKDSQKRETEYIKVRVVHEGEYQLSGKIYLRLMDDVTIKSIVLHKNKIIEATLFTEEEQKGRIQLDIAAIDIDNSIKDYYGIITDTDKKEGINLANITTPKGKIFIPDNYELSLKFTNQN